MFDFKSGEKGKSGEDFNEAFVQGAFRILLVFSLFLGGVLLLVPLVMGVCFWKNPSLIRRIAMKTRLIGVGVLFFVAGVLWWGWLSPGSYFLLGSKKVYLFITERHLLSLICLWSAGSGMILLGSPFLLRFKGKEALKIEHFKVKVKPTKELRLLDPNVLPIGINVQTGKVEGLDEKRRCSHVLIAGATGTGKSTCLLNSLLHAVKHGQPALVIDPKGEMGSLDRFLKLARRLDPAIEDRFKLFSMSDPARSASYNTLKNGTPDEKKDRILEALNWSEPFYQSMSASFLSSVLSAFEVTETELNLHSLEQLFSRKEEQGALKHQLLLRGKSGSSLAQDLHAALDGFFEKRNETLLGLQAQLSILNNPRIGPLLSKDKPGNLIDLRKVLEKKQIAYFQLNTLGNADTARRLGRMIIEDAKALAGYVYQTVRREEDRQFFPIFIDEFGSFAAKEFIEFLKQSRGARFAVHMFCQGLEDLDAVSPEFRRQSASNPMTTISFRVTDNETVNEVAALAGTEDILEQSYQVEGRLFASRTGLGNQRLTKQMKVEHDVFRNLDNLQAVVIEKSPSQVKGIQVFFPETLVAYGCGR